MMQEIFGLLPPERPEPDEKGGDFALWIKGIRELHRIAQEYQTPLERALHLEGAAVEAAPMSSHLPVLPHDHGL